MTQALEAKKLEKSYRGQKNRPRRQRPGEIWRSRWTAWAERRGEDDNILHGSGAGQAGPGQGGS